MSTFISFEKSSVSPSTSSTAGTSSNMSNNLCAHANVWIKLFDKLLSATTGPNELARVTIATKPWPIVIWPCSFNLILTNKNVSIAIIITISVKALIIPSWPFITPIFSCNFSLFSFIAFFLSSPLSNKSISFIPFKLSKKYEFESANAALYSTPPCLANFDENTGIKYPTIK